MARTEVTGTQIKDQSVSLTVDVVGILPVANGGTGSNTLGLNHVLLGNGTGALQAVAPGTTGNVLTSNGTTWVSAAPAGTGEVTLAGVQTLTNKTLIGTAGTAAAPPYSFAGDTDTGLYSPTANTLALSTGGTDRVIIKDTADSLGAGTAITGAATNSLSGLAIVYDGGVQTPMFTVSKAGASGNPVIGQFNSGGTIAAPTILGSGRAFGRNNFYGYDGTKYINGAVITATADGTPAAGSMPGRIVFHTNTGLTDSPPERMRLTSAGYLGIGNTAPAVSLDVTGEIRASTAGSNTTSVVTVGGTQTLTNKSLTSPAITTPTGIVKGDVGLTNVDNTSDATKDSATATLTNKTLTEPKISGSLRTTGDAVSLTFSQNGSGTAVNFLRIQNAVSGFAPNITVDGSDANVDLSVQPKGTGRVTYWAGSQAAAVLNANGGSTDVGWNLTTKGAGTVQANGVPVVTTTGTQTLTNKTLSGSLVSGDLLPVTGYSSNFGNGTFPWNNVTSYNINALGNLTLNSVPAVTTTGTQTLTNKTLALGSNTVSGTLAQFNTAVTDADLVDSTVMAQTLRANRNISGGGTITVSAGGSVLWSQRFLVISNGNGANFSTAGYFDITCPTSGTVTGVGGATDVTATADGIPLSIWQALYYILPLGSANTSLAANFRVASYLNALDIPHNWVLICVRNGEGSLTYSFPNGINMTLGESMSSRQQATTSVAHTLVRRDASGNFAANVITGTTFTGNAATATSAATLTTARTINGVSFNGSANITVADSTKEPTITAGTTAQYWRGDKSWQTLNQDAVPDGTTNKAYTATEKTKLAGIATGATANSTDATLLARANHTGTQTAATISDFSTAADARVVAGITGKQNTSEKGVANGYASLDSGGKVPITQLPSSLMEYQGVWNASTNTPTLANGTGSAGDVYRVSVAGTALTLTFDVGDYVIYNGTTWEKSDTTDAVATVAGRTGNVTLTSADVGLGNVDNTSNVTERAATATLTNKNLTSATNTFPTFNQNTTGSAATLTTGRTFQTNLASTTAVSFDGSANVTPGVTGTLPVANGGTGVATLTGLVKGNGTTAFTAAVAGTDYVAPGGALGTPSSGTLTNCTFPTLNQSTTGSAATLTTARTIALSGAVTGTATSFNGSANITIPTTVSATQGGVIYGSSATAYASSAAGTAGQLLVSGGTGAPTWTANDLTAFPSSAFKKAAKAATTANLGTVTYANGTAGVGATITGPTGVSAVVFPAQDGIAFALNDRLLVKDQAAPAQNGVYALTTVGVAGTTAWVLTRVTDADTADEIAGALTPVDQGTANGGQLFTATFKPTDTLGTTGMPFYRVYTTLDGTTANTASKLVLRDASGNFSAGTITAALSGNATTATTLQNARTIAISGAVTGTATSFNGSANITVATTVSASAGGIIYGSSTTAYASTAAGVAGQLLTSGGAGAPTWTSTATAATASTVALRDANANLTADNFINVVETTATAAGTTALTIASGGTQVFTGTTTQTVTLPTTSVVPGQSWTIINQSSGAVTVYSSSGANVTTLATLTTGVFTSVANAPIGAAGWVAQILGAGDTLTATAKLTLAGTDGTTFTFPATSGTVVTQAGALGTPSSGTLTSCTGLPLTTGVTGTLPVGNGGTGAATLTGLVKGNGASAMTAAVAGTDFVAPAGTINLGTTAVTINRASGALTLAGITLTSPTFSSIVNTGTLTLPTSTDTLVGRATTDTLTNKTITAPVLSGTVTGTYTLGGTPTFPSTVVATTGAQTLTDKRITARIGTVASTATPSIDCDSFDQYNITALAVAITSVTITGTPTDGQKLMVRIKGTAARAITWGASFVSSGVAPLLTTTVLTKTHLCSFLYDSAAAKWVAVATDDQGY